MAHPTANMLHESDRVDRDRGAWVSGQSYAIGDHVTEGGVEYLAVIGQHYAGVFAADLAAGYWVVWTDVLQHGDLFAGGTGGTALTAAQLAALAAVPGLLTDQHAHANLADPLNRLTALPAGDGNYAVTITGGVVSYSPIAAGNWTHIAAAHTAVAGDQLSLDSRAAAFAVTMPAAPVDGQAVWFGEAYGINSLETNAVSVVPGAVGHTVDGVPGVWPINVNGAFFVLVWHAGRADWEVHDGRTGAGAGGGGGGATTTFFALTDTPGTGAGRENDLLFVDPLGTAITTRDGLDAGVL